MEKGFYAKGLENNLGSVQEVSGSLNRMVTPKAPHCTVRFAKNHRMHLLDEIITN